MGTLFFPQLVSGALAQYPIRKTTLVRTIKNVLPDSSMVLSRDAGAAHRIWQLAYTGLEISDVQALQAHFSACSGPFHAFTFIDPTENMLAWSSDLSNASWQSVGMSHFAPGLADPDGGAAGVTVTNLGQAALQISQLLTVPANYQYCLSLYAMSAQGSEIVLTRSGSAAHETTAFAIGPSWTRLVSSGQLNDASTEFTVGITLAAGQQVGLYGIQLEPQVSPSRYRPTSRTGGIYSKAHWGVEQLTTMAEAPGLYSTSFSIETSIQD